MNRYLIHHGVDGQKWGIMHGPPYPLDQEGKEAQQRQREAIDEQKRLEEKQQRINTSPSARQAAYKRTHRADYFSDDYKKVAELKKVKDIRFLSNAELDALNQRLSKENQYKALRAATPTLRQKLKKWLLNDILGRKAKSYAERYISKSIDDLLGTKPDDSEKKKENKKDKSTNTTADSSTWRAGVVIDDNGNSYTAPIYSTPGTWDNGEVVDLFPIYYDYKE